MHSHEPERKAPALRDEGEMKTRGAGAPRSGTAQMGRESLVRVPNDALGGPVLRFPLASRESRAYNRAAPMKQSITIAACVALAAISWRGFAASSPLAPEQERATFQLADTNLTVELVAAEPDVRAPVAIAWDADGRMFVAEMTDYPSGPVNGRIRLLEDRDGDGRYERATIFASNLAFPNGVMAWKNGVLVTAAPDIWFLADTNGDGVADVREKILTGFAEGNQQLRVNGLFQGIDNWIYGCNGRSDGEVKWADGTGAGSIRRHDFRFRPGTKQFEVIAGNSQFGMGHDDWGNRFPVFNNTPIRHVVMEDHYLERQPLLAGTDVVPSISPANEGNRVFALTPPTLLIPQAVGFFTSACGPSIFRGTALPESYRGNYFVCEPVQNVVQRRVLKPNGSTFVAEYADASDSPLPSTGRGVRGEGWERRGASDNANAAAPNHPSPSIPLPVEGRGKPEAAREFLASTDRWFHGVFTATGPDGAFYIVDFYRDLVEHPHWVAPEIRDKVDWRKGEEHGRIWRVLAKNTKAAKVEKLSGASNLQLVKALESENGWTRDTAQQLLAERSPDEVQSRLEALALRGASPATRIQAIHLLNESRHSEASFCLERQLADSDPRVRENAIRLAEGNRAPSIRFSGGWGGLIENEETLIKLVTMTDDPDARVRAQLASTLGVVSQWKLGGSVRRPWGRENIFSNPLWYAEVPRQMMSVVTIEQADVTSALARLAGHPQLDQWQGTAILSSAGTRPWPLLRQIMLRSTNETEEQGQLLARLCAATVASKNSNDLAGLAAWIADHHWMNRLPMAAAFVEALSPDQRAEALDRLNGVPLRLEAALACTNTAAPLPVRLAAVRLLGVAHSAEAVPALRSLLSRDQPEPLQVAAAKALVEWTDVYALAVLDQWPVLSKVARNQAVLSCIKDAKSSLRLLDFVENGRVPKVEINPAARQTLQKHRDPIIAARAKMIFAEAVSADREAVVAKYRTALKLEGDRAHGAAVFERTCVVCHQMQGVGAKVGPDLSGVGQHARETLLVEILDPSRQVLPDFVAYNAMTKSGDTFTGFIANESAATVTLRRANEPDVTLKRADLSEFKTSGNSLMPEGLEAGMSEQDVADLIEFLRRPDRTLFMQNQ
jgi:putative membrane-bound dehydrogenase-like protein